jgi:ABC-type polysaccharide/polyol phosphate export permease
MFLERHRMRLRELRRLYRYRELLYSFTWRDVRVRYKQSVMGLLWAVLTPMLIVGAGALVRVAAAKWSGTAVTPADMASVMVRAVVWSFVITSLRFGTNCLTGNVSLVTKIAFPKEVFPLAAVASSLFDFAVASTVVALVLLAIGAAPGMQALWVVPLMAIAVLQVAGLTLILSAANLFFRDVKYLVEIFLTYAIFFTPVLYPAEVVGDWKTALLLNPVAPLLEGMSDAVVKGVAPDPLWTGYSLLVAIALMGGGYWFFKQLEDRFAESI